MRDRGNRYRPDGSPVWPLRPDDLPSRGDAMSVAEQRKQLAILERRARAAGEAMGYGGES